jgi:hypothetical protein
MRCYIEPHPRSGEADCRPRGGDGHLVECWPGRLVELGPLRSVRVSSLRGGAARAAMASVGGSSPSILAPQGRPAALTGTPDPMRQGRPPGLSQPRHSRPPQALSSCLRDGDLALGAREWASGEEASDDQSICEAGCGCSAARSIGCPSGSSSLVGLDRSCLRRMFRSTDRARAAARSANASGAGRRVHL